MIQGKAGHADSCPRQSQMQSLVCYAWRAQGACQALQPGTAGACCNAGQRPRQTLRLLMHFTFRAVHVCGSCRSILSKPQTSPTQCPCTAISQALLSRWSRHCSCHAACCWTLTTTSAPVAPFSARRGLCCPTQASAFTAGPMQAADEAEAGVCRRRTAPQPQPSRQPEGCRACRLCALQSRQSSQVGAAREAGVDGMPPGLSWAAWLSLDWMTHNGMWDWPSQPHTAGVCPRSCRRNAP